MKNMLPAILGLGLVLSIPHNALAQDNAPPPGIGAPAPGPQNAPEIVTDRPDFTESPQTVPTRFKAQIESGYTFTRAGEEREHTIGEMLVRVPIAERIELRFGVPSYLAFRTDATGNGEGDASGFDDAFFGAKFALSAGSGETGLFQKPAIGLLIGTTLPTGADAFSEDNFQPEAAFALALDLTDTIALASNLGYARSSDSGQRFDQFFGSLALGVGLSEQVGVYFEVYGFTRVEAATSDGARFFNTGLTYLVNKDFQLDARVGVGLGNNVPGPDYFFGLGFAKRF